MSDLQPLNFPFGPVDERTDSKVLPVPRLASTVNFERRNDGILHKRYGSTALGQVGLWNSDDDIEPGFLASDNVQLLAFNNSNAFQRNVFSYSPGVEKWVERAFCSPATIARRVNITRDGQRDRYSASCAYANGYTLHAWVQDGDTYSEIYAQVVEEETGAIIIGPTLMAAASADCVDPKCIKVGDSLMLFYLQDNDVRCQVIDSTAISSGFGAAAIAALNISIANPHTYDVMPMADNTHYVLVHVVAGDLSATVLKNTVAHSTAASATITTNPDAIYSVGIDAASTGVFVVYTTDNPLLGLKVYNTSIALQTTDTEVIDDLSTEVSVKEIAGSGTALVIINNGVSANAAWIVAQSGSFTGSLVEFENYTFISRPVEWGQNVYAVGMTDEQVASEISQNNSYLLQLTYQSSSAIQSPIPVARFSVGQSVDNVGAGVRPALSPLAWITVNRLLYDATTLTALLSTVAGNNDAATLLGIEAFEFNFADRLNYRSVQSGDHWIFGGGQVYQYDGVGYTELGFSSYPRVSASAGTTGSLANGTYGYKVVYEWYDNNGNRHQSQPSEAETVTLAGANDSVTLTIRAMPPSRKAGYAASYYENSPVTAAVYRTEVGGDVYYRLEGGTATEFTVADLESGANSITYTDVASDAACVLTSREVLYTSGGVLPNVQPPASRALCFWNNRLWGISSEFPQQLWFTHEQTYGAGLAWSYTYLVETPEGGDCVALAAQDRLVIFKADSIVTLQGDGPSRTGAGGFYAPQVLTRGVGCEDMRSVATGPDGTVYFQSKRGIEALPRGSSSPTLISDPIYQTLTSYPTVEQADVFHGNNEVRFLLRNIAENEGVFVVYNYRVGEWYVDTVAPSGSKGDTAAACRWQDSLVYVKDVEIRKRSSSSYADSGETVVDAVLTTGDVRFDLVGRVQIPVAYLLGTFLGRCSVTIEASQDGGVTWEDSKTFTLTTDDYTVGNPAQLQVEFRNTATPKWGYVRYRVTVTSIDGYDNGGFAPNGMTLMVRNEGKGPLLGSAARG